MSRYVFDVLVMGLGSNTQDESAIRSFKLPIKEMFCKSHDILRYTGLILYSYCWVSN